MKKVLITGAAGFLGSHLCDRFIAEGCHVIAMDNLITGNIKNIEHDWNHSPFMPCRLETAANMNARLHRVLQKQNESFNKMGPTQDLSHRMRYEHPRYRILQKQKIFGNVRYTCGCGIWLWLWL